ncbi:hypothetical protein RJT34_05114 [Clitoria ternatea]|uniref:Pentatricopeptide repeat-containing protein n=1 Tax=Clitoria ternatea TaxID=43366 RepID=A0AAN9PR18_CLITE
MTIRTRKSKRKLHPEPPSRTISKKLRSKLPRRRRQKISPVHLTSVRFRISPEDPRFSVDSSSVSDFAGGGVEVSCNSSRASAVFADKGNTHSVNRLSSEFSRNRRSEKLKENEVVEVSETSCVDSNSGVQERGRSLILKFRRESNKPTENDDVSEVRTKSEITCEEPFNSKSGNGNLKVSSELNQNDVVSFSSGVRATSFEKEKNRVKENRGSESEYSQENCADLIAQSMVKQESDNNGVVSDLACSEQLQFSYCDDDLEYCSSQGTVFSDLHSEIFPECSQLQFSDYTPSLFVDSGSQFSQGSVGDTPSSMYSMFLQYRDEFSALGASQEFNTSSSDTNKFARFDDSEDEDSYQMLRKRERRQVFVLNYSERYFSTTEFGEMVLQQRAQMVHWIVEDTTQVVKSLMLAICSKGVLRRKEIYSMCDLVRDIGEKEKGAMNVNILNELIASLSKLGKGKVALEVFDKIVDFQCVPNADTYYFTIEALFRRKAFDLASGGKKVKEAHGLYVMAMEKGKRPHMSAVSFLIGKLCQEDENVKLALEMLDGYVKVVDMMKPMESRGLKLDAYSNIVLASGYSNGGEMEEVVKCLCLKALDWEMAEKLQEEMKEKGLHHKGITRAMIGAVKEMEKEAVESESIIAVA